MTKKDYELMASEIRIRVILAENNYQLMGLVWLARSLTTRLEERDTRFNREKFMDACGIEKKLQ